MKTSFSKNLIATAIAGAAAFVSTSAMATTFPPFSVSQADNGIASVTNTEELTGAYNLYVTFTSATTYTETLLWQLTAFYNPDTAKTVAIAPNQDIFALFQGNGTFSTSGGTTTFTQNVGSNAGLGLELFQDFGNNVSFSLPPAGTTSFISYAANGDTINELATGNSLVGSGNETCTTSGKNCGSFGVTTSFSLTSFGLNYFVSPVPFYNMEFTNAVFNGVPTTVGTTAVLNGVEDATFNIPEPTSLALIGLGLMGFAFRSKKAV